MSELLTEHAKLHPGHGVYYQLRKYYRSLPEKEILASPELMSGMSILCSLTFDVDGSEKWYNTLKDYADGLDRRAGNFREVRGLVRYLDIALPHRGSLHIKDILLSAFDQLQAGGIRLPEFSVTSNLPSVLRGGKDFSSWVPKDRLLYSTIRKPVEALLGRLGVGLPDVALAESRYEKGEDISDVYLTKARCYLQRGEYRSALALLGRLLDYFTRYDRALDRIEALILLAVCRRRMEEADWREHLAAALELAWEYGYVTVFTHEGAALLPLLKDFAWAGDEK